MPPVTIPIVPGVTLTANTATILGNAALLGYLRITLCGFGPVVPLVTGTCMLADAGIPRLLGPAATFSQILFGNDVITPAKTFYEIAILDKDENVIQAGLYQFLNTDGTVDLSDVSQIVGPYGFNPGSLEYLPCSGAVPGSTYVAPARVLAVAYNGVLMPEGAAGPTLSYTVAVDEITITLNFATDAEDRIDAFCVL